MRAQGARGEGRKEVVPLPFLRLSSSLPCFSSTPWGVWWKQVGMMELDPTVFGEKTRVDILQRVVVWQRAGWRAGTAKTKTRSEVRGGGK